MMLAFKYLLPLFIGISSVTILFITPTEIVQAKTPREIAKIARKTTVQIQGFWTSGVVGGSGVIIGKTGNLYTILTVNHVVQKEDATYRIRTYNNQSYKINNIQRLAKKIDDPDLAIVTFNCDEDLPIAILGDSDQDLADIGAQVYVSGFPSVSGVNVDRWEYEFSRGDITSRRRFASQGYSLRYNAVTRGGMSGGPVFNVEGEVIGLHGQGDIVGNVTLDTNQQEGLKTGFNSAIPINTFVKIKPSGLNLLFGRSSSLAVLPNIPTSPPISTDDLTLKNTSPTVRVVNNNSPATTSTLINNQPTIDEPKEIVNNDTIVSTDARKFYIAGLSFYDLADKQFQGTDQDGANLLLEQALVAFDNALKLDPTYLQAYFQKGNTLYQLNRLSEAIANYDQALKIQPKSFYIVFNRAKIKYEMGDIVGATTDYTQALRMINDSPNRP